MNTAIRSIRFPTAYTVLFVLIALVALGTWFVPAGQYDRVENLELNREVPVPGTYKRVDQAPEQAPLLSPARRSVSSDGRAVHKAPRILHRLPSNELNGMEGISTTGSDTFDLSIRSRGWSTKRQRLWQVRGGYS